MPINFFVKTKVLPPVEELTEQELASALRQATGCLNEISSFLSFEKLQGSASHLSRVFHAIAYGSPFALISAWRPELSLEENNARTARLLLDLPRDQCRAIQLLGTKEVSDCGEKDLLERAFFILYEGVFADEFKKLMLSLCNKYDQHAVALDERNDIRVFDASGRVEKMFTRSNIEPHHLKRIWTAISGGRRFTSIESGFLDGSPLFLCGPQYDSLGLRSDIPPGAFSKVWQRDRNLIRVRPFRDPTDAERARLADIHLQTEILAEAEE